MSHIQTRRMMPHSFIPDSLWRFLWTQVVAGALAAAFGFLVLWPKTMREGFARLFCTLIASGLFGPLCVIQLYHAKPDLFASAKDLAIAVNIDPALGLLFVATPVATMAGLPAWWLIGAIIRMFEKNADGVLGAIGNWIKKKIGE